MRQYIQSTKLFLFLVVFWFLLALSFEIESIIAGVLICLFVTIFTHIILYLRVLPRSRHLKVINIIMYVFILFYEIYKSSIIYVINIISKKHTPTVFDIKLDVTDPVLVSIIANSITLTPGTISIETKDNVITVLTLMKSNHTEEEVEQNVRDKFERLLKDKRGDQS